MVTFAAEAVKPTPPFSAECGTVSSSGMVYKARCVVRGVAGTLPASVTYVPVDEKVAKVSDIQPPSGTGMGEWFLTVEFLEQKPLYIPFQASFDGGTALRIGANYDPFGKTSAPKTAPMGAMIKKEDGTRIREYMSK